MTGPDFIALVREAITDPRRSGARLGALALPPSTQWEALLAVSAASVLGIWLVALLGGGGIDGEGFLPAPFLLLMMQIVAMLVLAGGLFVLGRLARGVGDFGGSLRVIVWLQGLMVLVQIVQIVAMLVLPPLAGLLSVISIVAAGWVATGLVAGLHGFRSLPLTFLGLIAGLFGVAIVMSLVLAPILSMTV